MKGIKLVPTTEEDIKEYARKTDPSYNEMFFSEQGAWGLSMINSPEFKISGAILSTRLKVCRKIEKVLNSLFYK